MDRIGAVIVTHNSERCIHRCLDSLPAGLPTLVVDNASSDATCSKVRARPGAKLIANPWNRGFAAAANQGIGAANCEFVLLLNPDVELTGGIEALAVKCEDAGVAAVGAQLVDDSGRPQTGFMARRFPTPATLAFEVMGINRLWPGNRVNRRYRCLDLDPAAESNINQPPGALMMLRRDVWQRLGGFDESFFPVWFEDVDFAMRAAAAGHVMKYVPSVTAKHEGAHSVGQLPPANRALYWYGTLLMYAAKHFAPRGLLAVCGALVLGSIFRAILGMFQERSLKAVCNYARVIRLAGFTGLSGWNETRYFSSALAVR
jgi:GT2 family glycosyltransferase